MVIDRIKVRPDLKQRLAESFEAALRLAGGRAIAVQIDSTPRTGDEDHRPKEHLFSRGHTIRFPCN